MSEDDATPDFDVPKYDEALLLVCEWEDERKDFSWLISRLYRLWVPDKGA